MAEPGIRPSAPPAWVNIDTSWQARLSRRPWMYDAGLAALVRQAGFEELRVCGYVSDLMKPAVAA